MCSVSSIVTGSQARGHSKEVPQSATGIFKELVQQWEGLREAAIARTTAKTYGKSFKAWEKFCAELGYPRFISGRPQREQAAIVGLFAGWCKAGRNNNERKSNKFATFKARMAAVRHMHRKFTNKEMDIDDCQLKLVTMGYKRSAGRKEHAQPVDASIILQATRSIKSNTAWMTHNVREIVRASIVIAVMALNRRSELWMHSTMDTDTHRHIVKDRNVTVRSHKGAPLECPFIGAAMVDIHFESTKTDQCHTGNTLRLYATENRELCPVVAAVRCKLARKRLSRDGVKVGPYLTSIDQKSTVKAAWISRALKGAAKEKGIETKRVSCHSLRVAGACALLQAGYSDTVIQLMGRWSSDAFRIYTRLNPGMLRDISVNMATALNLQEFPETTRK